MSTESFVCCDNPDCPRSTRAGDEAAEGWISFNVTLTGGRRPMEDLPGDACSRECLPAAVSAVVRPQDENPQPAEA